MAGIQKFLRRSRKNGKDQVDGKKRNGGKANGTTNGGPHDIAEFTAMFQADYDKAMERYDKIKNLDFFVLDNSIRESTVGQLRGHTIENKWAIYNECKKMKFTDIIVASFSHMTRVDDVFIKDLMDKGEDPATLWAFSEITEGIKDGVPDTVKIPVGLRKLKEFGLYNVIFELDLSDTFYDFKKFPMSKYLELVKKLVKWTKDNLHKDAKIMVNFRDIMDVIRVNPERVFELAQFLCTLPEELKVFGLVYEDSGKSVPDAIGSTTRFLRKIMDDNNHKGKLLMHIHEKFGFKDASTLEALIYGADGMWASTIIEGASMGAASSTVTLMNLIRLGNKKVLKKYNCQHLRKCAINVTKITTGVDPFIKQPIYGERALVFVFDLNPDEFDLADFFEEEPVVRITTLASPEMIKTKLIKTFGEDPQFTEELALKMKELMLTDLKSGRKEEYMSPAGLAVLFDRAGGELTEPMADVISNMKLSSQHAEDLIKEVREDWDTWDSREAEEFRGDDMLNYDSFYNGFMAPYFGCYKCWDTKQALAALDMDADNSVDWKEFKTYLVWAMRQYPEIKDKQELVDKAFRKGIIPAMHDECVVKKRTKPKENGAENGV